MKPTKIGEALEKLNWFFRVTPRVSLKFMQEIEKAYIAGFLDGDGCIMVQFVRRKDYVFGYQIRTSIVFYQKANNLRILE